MHVAMVFLCRKKKGGGGGGKDKKGTCITAAALGFHKSSVLLHLAKMEHACIGYNIIVA